MYASFYSSIAISSCGFFIKHVSTAMMKSAWTELVAPSYINKLLCTCPAVDEHYKVRVYELRENLLLQRVYFIPICY